MRRLLRVLLLLVAFAGICLAGGAFAVYQWALADLPDLAVLESYHPSLEDVPKTLDSLIYFPIGREDMTPALRLAFLAAEDPTFYDRPQGFIRKLWDATLPLRHSGMMADRHPGTSPITQQVIRRLRSFDESPPRNRMIRQILLAAHMEATLSRDTILWVYLNKVYLGNYTYGVEAAARACFGRHASELSIAQCAVLAALPKAPTEYNPYKNPEGNRNRQLWILGQMLEKDFITQAEYDEAKDAPIGLLPKPPM